MATLNDFVNAIKAKLAEKPNVEDLPTWSNISGKPAVIAAGADATAARAAIGAGISNLAIGTTGTTAKAGDYAPPTATDAASGLVELATAAEATTGTDTARAVTPAGLKAVTSRLELGTADIRRFGAPLDGAGDDAPAVRAAIDAGYSRIYIPRRARFNSVVNCTNLGRAVTLVGDGAHYDDRIICNTGSMAIDAAGAFHFRMEDLCLYSYPALPTPSKIGVFYARTTTVNNSEYNGLRNVRIHFDSNPAATALGCIGIYNVAAEVFEMDHCYLGADTPLAVYGTNDLGITSPYTTLYTMNSATSMAFRNVTMIQRKANNFGMILQDVHNLTFDQCYWWGGDLASTHAFSLRGTVTSVKIHGQVENVTAIGYIATDYLKDLKVEAFTSPGMTGNAFVFDPKGPYSDGVDLRVDGAAGATTNFISSAPHMLRGGILRIGRGSNLTDVDLVLDGTQVLTQGRDGLGAAIAIDPGSDYTINGANPFTGGTTAQRTAFRVPSMVGRQWFDSTLGKPVQISVPGVQSQNKFAITAPATASGNVTLNLDGIANNVAVLAGDTASDVAAKIQAARIRYWTPTNRTLTEVTLTKNSVGVNGAPTFNGNATGVTATASTTVTGTAHAWVDATGATV